MIVPLDFTDERTINLDDIHRQSMALTQRRVTITNGLYQIGGEHIPLHIEVWSTG